MQIPVMIEPNYRRSIWCKQTLEGMYLEAKRKKYDLVFVEELACLLDYRSSFLKCDNPLAVVIGTSVSWIPDTLKHLERNGIRALLISYEPPPHTALCSVVRMDYVNAMSKLMDYFYSNGKKRIALYGLNPNSSADRIKENYFSMALSGMGESDPSGHIYYNYADLTACFNRFLPNARRYDALICANDIVAASAILYLKAAEINVPKELLVVGFGESSLSKNMRPSITTATLDHEEMGRQAVMLYAFLHRQAANVSASVRVECKLLIRESTMNLAAHAQRRPLSAAEPVPVDFYSDQEVQALLEIEDFYAQCDELDIDILHQLARHATYEAIAESLSTTVSTVGYRLRRMQTLTTCATREEMIERMVNHIMK